MQSLHIDIGFYLHPFLCVRLNCGRRFISSDVKIQYCAHLLNKTSVARVHDLLVFSNLGTLRFC